MKRIVGIDIGNSTTEAALAEIHSNGEVSSYLLLLPAPLVLKERAKISWGSWMPSSR